MNTLSNLRRYLLAIVLCAVASLSTSAYTYVDGIKFKGQWLKKYLLVPTDPTQNVEVEDSKRFIINNDDLTLRINREGFITQLILDVKNKTAEPLSMILNKSYIKIGDEVRPLKMNGKEPENVWVIPSKKKKNSYKRCYVRTIDNKPINISESTPVTLFFTYKTEDETKKIEIPCILLPSSEVEGGIDDED